MLVCSVIAVAAVMGYAMLASSSTQMQISANAADIVQVEALAESGINYAMYNLQNPYKAPAFAGSFWPGASNMSLGASIPGTFNVVVSSIGSNLYSIQSTATLTGANGSSLTRQITATVQATTAFGVPNQAAGFVGDVTIPSSATVAVTGDLHTSGAVTMSPTSSVSGTVYAQSLELNGANSPGGFVQTSSGTPASVPTSVTDYTHYTYNGQTYAATALWVDPSAGATLGPTASNPAGVYYTPIARNVNLNGVTINGTLIVKGSGTKGNVLVRGVQNTITPAKGFPALVVAKKIEMYGANKNLIVNGLCWAYQGVSGIGDNTGSNLTVNGSLLIPSQQPITGGYNGSLTLTYNADNANVPNFSTQVQNPVSLRVLTWSE